MPDDPLTDFIKERFKRLAMAPAAIDNRVAPFVAAHATPNCGFDGGVNDDKVLLHELTGLERRIENPRVGSSSEPRSGDRRRRRPKGERSESIPPLATKH